MFSKNLKLILFGLSLSLNAAAELTQQTQATITDSEEPFARRLYSYDFDVSDKSIVHTVYSKPIKNSHLSQIIYMPKSTGKNWPDESNRVILETAGQLASTSTQLIYDNKSQTTHISYIVERDFIDSNGDTHRSGLVYQKITNDTIGEKINVSSGAFHSLMQIDERGNAIFIREYEDFVNNSVPFPKKLRVQMPLADNKWTDRTHILNLPAAEDYRLANFIYDTERKRFHISYGNKDANFLRNTYPTTNPPVSRETTPVFFPPGAGHNLIYAYSDDLDRWHSSSIDSTGSLSENEFWTDLIIRNDNVYSASYRYKTDALGIHQGTSTIFTPLSDENRKLITVAGKTRGASEHRAGMGVKILTDKTGGFHGIWDNSSDAPIDSESAHGTTMYRYSPDGLNWETRQVILPFSVEGKVKAKIVNDQLFVMLLGDASDTRLIFSEYKIPTPTATIMEVSTDKMFYGTGESIKLHARLQGTQTIADLYILVTGPYDKTSSGALIPTSTTAFHYFGADLAWHKITNTLDTQAVLSHFPLNAFNDFFHSETARNSIPFKSPGRYRLYSAATEAGSNLQDFKPLTPLYTYDLHICKQVNCAEIVSN